MQQIERFGLPSRDSRGNWKRFPGRKAIQDIRAQVHAIRPYDSPSLAIHVHLFEELDIVQRSESAASAKDTIPKVDLPLAAVGEFELQPVLRNVPNLSYPW